METNDVVSHLLCPICFEIPRHHIMQCRRGHHICKGCKKSLSHCPQCRIPYGKEDIRNLAMESLLDSMKFPCPYNGEGCPEKVPRNELDSHDNSCKFNPASKLFCSRNLGWKDCKAAVDESSILSHLEEHHPVQEVDSSTFQIELEYQERSMEETVLVHFDPLVVTSLGTPILLRTVMTDSGHIVLTCFMFRDSEKKSFRVKYRIEFKDEAEIEWSGYVQPYRKFQDITHLNSFFIPVQQPAKKQVDLAGASAHPVDPVTNINIKLAIYMATDNAPHLNAGDFQKINIFEQVALPVDDPSLVVLFTRCSCDACNAAPIKKIMYRCLQCNNYVLCSRCMEQGHHGHHIFVRVQERNKSSYNEFFYYRRVSRVTPRQGYK